eukprot:12329059-Alexandrium_andersonii.AAC.1
MAPTKLEFFRSTSMASAMAPEAPSLLRADSTSPGVTTCQQPGYNLDVTNEAWHSSSTQCDPWLYGRQESHPGCSCRDGACTEYLDVCQRLP